MPNWSMIIDLDKCVACQGCSIACRMENNTPVVSPSESALGRSMLWNDVFPLRSEEEGAIASGQAKFLTRPCMHCEDPPCIKVCPVEATYLDDEGIVRQNYQRCIGCRLCTVACPYGVRYFNWYEPQWSPEFARHITPDKVVGKGSLEGPAVRPKGVVEKCTFCIHRLHKARARSEAEERDFRPADYVPACVQTCTGKARFFGDLDNPNSTVSQLAQSRRAFRLLDEAGTHPKVIYLHEG
ncbi:MAG: 4Fe-4S dicluster domain-containing protein [Anaerolineae bacterium]|nr:4Fe-4S dicluster domain-containing protein [Anaerolineae bacterium]